MHFNKKKSFYFLLLSIFAFSLSFFVKAFYIQYSIELTQTPIFVSKLIHQLIFISALVFTFFIVNVMRSKAFIALFITNIILSLLLFADTVYGRYYGIPLTVPILYQIGFINDVSSSTASLIKWKDIVFFIDIPFWCFILYAFRTEKKYRFNWKVTVAFLLALVVSIGAFTTLSKDVNRALHAYERKNIAKDLGVLYFHAYDIFDFTKNKVVANIGMNSEEKELVQSYLNNKQSPNTIAHGLKNKNLIVIQVEALQGFVIDLELNGNEITPYLNALADQHLYFSNIFHQVASGNTSDAEFMMNTGLYPAPIGAVNYLHPTNNFVTLPKLLGDSYSKMAFHAYDSSFWNREVVYKNFGYDQFISKKDFDFDEKLGWALSDQSFFRQSLDLSTSNEPFYSSMITLSSHHPYDAFENFDLNVSPYESTQVGNYLKSVHYLDQEIKRLVDRLESENLLDDTIIVIFGDHSGLYMDQRGPLSQLLNLKDHSLEWDMIQKVPMWIIEPSGLKGKIEKIGGQVNIFPTILDLLDIEPPLPLGDSLLTTGNGYVVKRDGTVIWENFYYDNGRDALFSTTSQEAIEITPELRSYINNIKREMQLSDLILKKNLFNNDHFLKMIKK